MPNTANLEAMFRWLTRVGAGRRFPGTPIGWYQMHQMCAIDNIEHRAKERGPQIPAPNGFDVKMSRGEIFARPHGRRGRFVSVGSTREVFKNADDCARGDRNAALRGLGRVRKKRRG